MNRSHHHLARAVPLADSEIGTVAMASPGVGGGGCGGDAIRSRCVTIETLAFTLQHSFGSIRGSLCAEGGRARRCPTAGGVRFHSKSPAAALRGKLLSGSTEI